MNILSHTYTKLRLQNMSLNILSRNYTKHKAVEKYVFDYFITHLNKAFRFTDVHSTEVPLAFF